MDLKVGDTVRLKSGGPLMTVMKVSEGEVWTCWFDGIKKENRGSYPAETLVSDEYQKHQPGVS